jgi:imidazole glycerol phosphate synthase subunit HisF
LALDIHSIEPSDEVNQDVVDTFGNLSQKALCDFFIGGIVGEIHRNEELFGFGIDVTNVNTAFVGEVDPIALAGISRAHGM